MTGRAPRGGSPTPGLDGLMTTADHRVLAMSKSQMGAVTRFQAQALGLSKDQVRGRVENGFFERFGANGLRVAGAPFDLRMQLKHVLLDIGEPVCVAGETAAAIYGFEGFRLALPFHVLMLRDRNVKRPGVKTHRTQNLALVDQATFDEFSITTAARTLIDLSRRHPPEALTATLDSALSSGLVSESHLHRRIVALRSQGRYGLPQLMEVVSGSEIHRGVESWLEREFLRLIDEAGLPRPETQAVLNRAGDQMIRVDCRFPGTPVVVELLGYRWHRTQSQMSSDARRMNALIADGYRPYQFTYRQVVSEFVNVIATVTRALGLE